MEPNTTARSSSRVVIVEDHQLFAESLELVLSTEAYDVRRVPLPEGGGSLATLRTKVLATRARIVLLDLDLGELGDGAVLVAPLARAGLNVVVLTASTDRARWGGCVRAGARKVIPKCGPLQETLSVVRRLHQGLPVMGTEELQDLLRAWHLERAVTEEKRERLARLTPREGQVLRQLMAGLTVREIARNSVVSDATVRTQVKSILAKLEVSCQLAAVGVAHQLGWQPALAGSAPTLPNMRHAGGASRP
jgi:two-component system nitrate/nitrite response regulator NarL